MTEQTEANDLWAAYRSLIEEIPQTGSGPSCPPCRRTFQTVATIEASDSDDEEIMLKIDELNRMQNDDTKSQRSAHEIPLEQIEVGPIPAIIPEEAAILPVAIVHHFSGHFSVADTIGRPVAPGSLLADENRNPITRVIDLFGPVENPKMILKGQIPVGTELFAVEGDADFPDPDEIERKYPGCDASNRYDEAVENQDFSDDEEERNYRKMKRLQTKKSAFDPCDEYELNYQNMRDYEK
ncbi:NAF1-domain-containing protein [Histomonas meleagridis]|uniref:NAF1-domain-containing protein n=1 Tax=Histomonas meleagridis TaxID=135588 RepID=UPI00355942AC|nr:NAF1-domain-containing protein [Histomonas meleagridis]KAH0797178.1 NAF1-domain-containing protein [Histomonas meleagridis]